MSFLKRKADVETSPVIRWSLFYDGVPVIFHSSKGVCQPADMSAPICGSNTIQGIGFHLFLQPSQVWLVSKVMMTSPAAIRRLWLVGGEGARVHGGIFDLAGIGWHGGTGIALHLHYFTCHSLLRTILDASAIDKTCYDELCSLHLHVWHSYG